MNSGKVQELLSILGCHSIKLSYAGGNKVQSSCPFAISNHSGGRDRHPSFVVWANDEAESSYYCSGCKVSGASMKSLVWRYGHKTGRDTTSLIEFVHKHEKQTTLVDRLGQIGTYEKKPKALAKKKKREPPKPLDEHVFNPFRNQVARYLVEERGLTRETIRAWGLGDDTRSERAQIPIRDRDGKLFGITGRHYAKRCCCGMPFREWPQHATACPECDARKPPKYLHSKGLRKEFILFGEHMIEEKYDRCYLVEGHLDAINLWQLGYRNVLAIMGSDLSDIQANKLVKWFSMVVVVPDGDRAGHDMAHGSLRKKGVKAKLEDRICLVIKMSPLGSDPGKFTAETARELLGEPNALTA